MKKRILAAFALFLLGIASSAQETPQVDVAVGYSHLHILYGFTIPFDGASSSVAVNANRWLGAVGDLGVYHGSPGGMGITGETYTAGPRFSYRKLNRIVPFAQALIGGSHFSASSGGISGGGSEFALGLGGGADVLLSHSGRVALRGQLEYFGIRANGSTTNAARLSAALVYRIGKRADHDRGQSH